LDLEIWVRDFEIEVKDDLYSDLINPSEVEIAYSDPEQTTTESVEYVSLFFEFGDSYRIEYDGDVPGCETPCIDMARDIVEIRINSDMTIGRRISSLRYLSENGT